MNKLKIRLIITMTLAILLWSCECPTDIDPDNTVILPTKFANMLFINAMPETNLNRLVVLSASKVLDTVDIISYSNAEDKRTIYKDYEAVGITVNGEKNTVRLISEENPTKLLFNDVLNIDKNKHYTFIAYGADEDVQSIIVRDNIDEPKAENIYYRCFNVSPDAPLMYINVSTEGYSRDFTLYSGEFSDIAASPSGVYTITVTSADSTINNAEIPNIQFSKGKINNILFKGYFKRKNADNKNEISIVTAGYPYK
ncbi:hypothetical protein ACFLSQ_02145 [Bacteroidota bacterium]